MAVRTTSSSPPPCVLPVVAVVALMLLQCLGTAMAASSSGWVDLRFNASFPLYMHTEDSANCKLMTALVLEHMHDTLGLKYELFSAVSCHAAPTFSSTVPPHTGADAPPSSAPSTTAQPLVEVELQCGSACVAAIAAARTPICVVFRGVTLCSPGVAAMSQSKDDSSSAVSTAELPSARNATEPPPETSGPWRLGDNPTAVAIFCVVIVVVVALATYGAVRMKLVARSQRRRQVVRRASALPLMRSDSQMSEPMHRFSRQPSQEFVRLARASVMRDRQRVGTLAGVPEYDEYGHTDSVAYSEMGYSDAAWDNASLASSSMPYSDVYSSAYSDAYSTYAASAATDATHMTAHASTTTPAPEASSLSSSAAAAAESQHQRVAAPRPARAFVPAWIRGAAHKLRRQHHPSPTTTTTTTTHGPPPAPAPHHSQQRSAQPPTRQRQTSRFRLGDNDYDYAENIVSEL